MAADGTPGRLSGTRGKAGVPFQKANMGLVESLPIQRGPISFRFTPLTIPGVGDHRDVRELVGGTSTPPRNPAVQCRMPACAGVEQGQAGQRGRASGETILCATGSGRHGLNPGPRGPAMPTWPAWIRCARPARQYLIGKTRETRSPSRRRCWRPRGGCRPWRQRWDR
jgi:hypothetical protein